MAQSKIHLYPVADQYISTRAYALKHPARLQILRTLTRKGTCSVQVLARDHPISKEALSEHLKILREVQFITSMERYPNTFYSILDENVLNAYQAITHFFSELEEIAGNQTNKEKSK